MKRSLKENVMDVTLKAAFAIGKSTAMSISRLGSFEASEDSKANEALKRYEKESN